MNDIDFKVRAIGIDVGVDIMNWATVRIPQSLFDEVSKKLPEFNATSVSEMARRLLVEYLERVATKEVLE